MAGDAMSRYVPTDPLKAEFLTELHVHELRDGRHELLTDLVFYSAELRGVLIDPAGTLTNYASSPRVFWNVVPPDGPWKWAACVHDAASHGELRTESGQRIHCVKHVTDNLFKEAMGVPPCDQVSGWKRWIMYRFVKEFGSGAYGGTPAIVEPDPPGAA